MPYIPFLAQHLNAIHKVWRQKKVKHERTKSLKTPLEIIKDAKTFIHALYEPPDCPSELTNNKTKESKITAFFLFPIS